MNKKALSLQQIEELFGILKARFEKNMPRHENLSWTDVKKKLKNNPEKLWSLGEMERTEGEPDVIGLDEKTGEYIFFDCAAESPKGRRSLCYDRDALEKRKVNKPAGSAVETAKSIGVDLLTEAEYRQLQTIGKFDAKTSSWIKTPSEIRNLGGALFGDRRYETVFVYHNSADSYYAARGFRGSLKV